MVIGGGLAGIAAACSLADRGVPVTLLEKRPYLGGRAFSFPDAETGRHIDNGQHIYLGCCTAYTGLLQRLGVFDRTTLQPRMRAVVVNRNGKRGELNAAPLLPSPLHLLPSFLTYPHLSLREKLRAGRRCSASCARTAPSAVTPWRLRASATGSCATGSRSGPSPRCGTC